MRELAERVGFEPTCRLPDNTLSRRARYDHFGTSPFDPTAQSRPGIIPSPAVRPKSLAKPTIPVFRLTFTFRGRSKTTTVVSPVEQGLSLPAPAGEVPPNLETALRTLLRQFQYREREDTASNLAQIE